MAQANPYPLRIDNKLMEKFKIIAKANGRSVNKEIEQLIINAIFEYEAKQGTIKIDIDDPYQ